MARAGSWDAWRGVEPGEQRKYGELLEGARQVARMAIAAMPMEPGHPHYVEWKEQVEGQPYMGI